MIIVLAPSDATLVRTARQQAFNDPATFGKVYLAGQDAIPMLGETENLFFSGHAIKQGDSGNAEIGEESGALAYDGLELWQNFNDRFPQQYRGSVFIDACESADFELDNFSIIEQFRSQSDLFLESTSVFGRTGSPSAADPIPPPGDPLWAEPEV